MRALSGAISALESAAVIIALSKCWNFQQSSGATCSTDVLVMALARCWSIQHFYGANNSTVFAPHLENLPNY